MDIIASGVACVLPRLRSKLGSCLGDLVDGSCDAWRYIGRVGTGTVPNLKTNI